MQQEEVKRMLKNIVVGLEVALVITQDLIFRMITRAKVILTNVLKSVVVLLSEFYCNRNNK
ncbi:hypothetical protein ASE99_23510 [Serratia sp. Leaf51]|nr:hypothetical protein ASE99_23510 [Serratia sp. Leaf51]